MIVIPPRPTMESSDVQPDFRSPAEPDAAYLARKARVIRRRCVDMVLTAQSGHVGGSLSAADLLVALYHGVMRHDPRNPQWSERDRFVLSKGHCTPVYYATLADCGYFPLDTLKTFRRPGSILQGHPCSKLTPGVDASTGTLGLGLATACGMALAAKKRGADHSVYVLCGDGEQQEGQIWEAAMFARKYGLANLIAFTDRNRLQTDGDTESVMPLEPLVDKWRAFGWDCWTIDGHSYSEIFNAIRRARLSATIPTMIVANTIKGKGVSFMENAVGWHGTPPNAKQAAQAMDELS